MNQSEAGALFGICRQQIASWERGVLPQDFEDRWLAVRDYLDANQKARERVDV